VERVDVVPTLLGLMGWPAHPNFQGIDVLASNRPAASDRLLFFHTENALSRADALLLAGRWKLIRDRKTESEALFDVVADPGERKNLIERGEFNDLADKLRQTLAAWRSRQLAYYFYRSYYQHYYRPGPPPP